MKITIKSKKKDGRFFYTLSKDGEFVLEVNDWKQLTLPEILRRCENRFEYEAIRLAMDYEVNGELSTH